MIQQWQMKLTEVRQTFSSHRNKKKTSEAASCSALLLLASWLIFKLSRHTLGHFCVCETRDNKVLLERAVLQCNSIMLEVPNAPAKHTHTHTHRGTLPTLENPFLYVFSTVLMVTHNAPCSGQCFPCHTHQALVVQLIGLKQTEAQVHFLRSLFTFG